MGCCFSNNHGGRRIPQLPPASLSFSKAPPPSIEEETVKEVLSETPNFIKTPPDQEEDELKKNNTHIDPTPFPGEEKKISKGNSIKNEMKLIFKDEEIISDKENSEVCSLSIGETVSTPNFDCARNQDEGEVKQRVKRSPAANLPAINRSIAGDFGHRRDGVAGKSPNRINDQSPDKRNNAGLGGGGGGPVKLVQSWKSSSGANQPDRRGFRPDPYRKYPGDGSGRRSRSPATNRSTMGRSQSTRRINGSPDRVTAVSPDGKRPGSSNAVATPNESLENPLVSLECFIFL